MIRALSLSQPWATLVAIGAKRIETRSWSTSYRGPIAIHAAKRFPGDCRALCSEEPFYRALNPLDRPRAAGYEDWYSLPLGAIVAVAVLEWVVGTPASPGRVGGHQLPPPEPEASFGDYAPGRFAWGLERVHRLAEPVPCRGALGLWAVPADVAAAVRRQLAAPDRA